MSTEQNFPLRLFSITRCLWAEEDFMRWSLLSTLRFDTVLSQFLFSEKRNEARHFDDFKPNVSLLLNETNGARMKSIWNRLRIIRFSPISLSSLCSWNHSNYPILIKAESKAKAKIWIHLSNCVFFFRGGLKDLKLVSALERDFVFWAQSSTFQHSYVSSWTIFLCPAWNTGLRVLLF